MPSHREDAPGTSTTHKKSKHSAAREKDKFNHLFTLYHKYLREAVKLQNREIPVGEDYDEAEEERQEKRLQKLARRALELHNYLVRKERLVDDNGISLRPDEPTILNITGTGSQFLDELVTNHINQRSDGSKGISGRHIGEERYMTIDELKEMVEQLNREGKFTGCPEDKEDMERFLLDTLFRIRMQMKAFRKQQLQDCMAEDQGPVDESLVNSAAAAKQELSSGEGPSTVSWEAAKMKLLEAVASGSLLIDENSGENVSTGIDHDGIAIDVGDDDEMTDEEVMEDDLSDDEESMQKEDNSLHELVDLVSDESEAEMNNEHNNHTQKVPNDKVDEGGDVNCNSNGTRDDKFQNAIVKAEANDGSDVVIKDQ